MHPVSRRSFLRISAIGAVTATVTSCTQPSPTVAPTSAPATTVPAATSVPGATQAAPTAEAPETYQEAPALAELVRTGKLPPIEQRLPVTPFVVGPGVLMTEQQLPNWTPGKYGGTIRSAHASPNWAPDIYVMANEPLLCSPDLSSDAIRGNVAESFKVENDSKDFTFVLRKGLKWSDGEPVTTEDVRFTYEDILLNEQVTPAFPAKLRTGNSPSGEPGKLEIIDDLTFKIGFAEPYGGFLTLITIHNWVSHTEILRPAHYLKKFHQKYTGLDAMADELKELNLTDEWWQLLMRKDCRNEITNPACAPYPTLSPWVPVDTGDAAVLTFERNPYYFKVDTQGQQLPYVDRLISVQCQDAEVVNLKLLAGDVDFLRESATLVKVPLYKENQAKLGLEVALLDQHADPIGLCINQTYDDPEWRTMAQDLRFRQAISRGIDRQEIIDSVEFGFASLPVEINGEENCAYDPQAANQLLDAIGMANRDAEGYRLTPGGKPFTLLIEHCAYLTDWTPAGELVTAHLKEIGIRAQVNVTAIGLHFERWATNEIMARLWLSEASVGPVWVGELATTLMDQAGLLWGLWRTSGGQQGEEPPDWAKQVIDLEKRRTAAIPGSPEHEQLVQAIYQWNRDNLPYLSCGAATKAPLVFSNKLANIATEGGHTIGANFAGEQIFYQY